MTVPFLSAAQIPASHGIPARVVAADSAAEDGSVSDFEGMIRELGQGQQPNAAPQPQQARSGASWVVTGRIVAGQRAGVEQKNAGENARPAPSASNSNKAAAEENDASQVSLSSQRMVTTAAPQAAPASVATGSEQSTAVPEFPGMLRELSAAPQPQPRTAAAPVVAQENSSEQAESSGTAEGSATADSSGKVAVKDSAQQAPGFVSRVYSGQTSAGENAYATGSQAPRIVSGAYGGQTSSAESAGATHASPVSRAYANQTSTGKSASAGRAPARTVSSSQPVPQAPASGNSNSTGQPVGQTSEGANTGVAVEARQIPVAQVPVIPVAADAAQKSIEMPQTAPPTENSVKTEKTGTRKADVRQTTPATGAAQAPYVAVPVPVAVPLPPLPVISTASAPRHTEAAAVQPKSEESAEKAPPTDTVLQVTIRNPNGETVPAPVAATPVVVPTPVVAVPVKPEPVRSAPEVPVVASANSPAAATALNPAAPAATQAAPSAPAESPRPAAEAKAPVEPTLPPDPPQQQIKSVSLEFSPDGAGDVKLRVSERGGEVHISLHSSDASLSGKIHEGVHDLVGSLSSAGYDAEAWTPGQGHHGAQQQQEQRKPPRPDPDEAGAEDFGGLFEQPIQEVS